MISKAVKQKSRLLFFIVVLAALWFLGRSVNIDTERVQKALRGFPIFYSGMLYIALYVGVTFFLFFSKDLFWLMGAVLFGPLRSALFIWLAEIISAGILFKLSFYMGRGSIESTLPDNYARLDKKIGSLSFLWLFLLRVAPMVPYRFLDLAAGLTAVSFRKYMAAVVFGTPLKIFWIQYLLAALGKSVLDDPSAVAGYFARNTHLLVWSFFYLFVVAAVAIKFKRN